MTELYTRGDRYRMPVVFGPMPGPRQGPDGHGFDMTTARRSTTTVSFLTEASALARLLPAGCTLQSEPVVTVEHVELHALEWLAGRGYSLLGIKFPIHARGRSEGACGPFLAVLWENRCEPILSGREELGFAKLFADLPPAHVAGRSRDYEASWDGHTFIRIVLSDMEAAPPPDRPSTHDGVLHHRYLPPLGIGRKPVDEMVISPMARVAPRYLSFERGAGTVEFVRSTWQQLPTMFHIVNTLADLPMIELRGSTYSETTGTSDLSDQRPLA